MVNKLFDVVMDLAERMLVNGAEIYRVEDSIDRILSTYGINRVDAFIVSSVMVVSIYEKDTTVHTQTRRVKSIVTNMDKLHLLNDLSRRICSEKLTADEIKKEIDKIDRPKSYSIPFQIFCNALIAFSFTLFFGGTITEAFVSFFIGLIIKTSTYFMRRVNTNALFGKFLASLLLSLLTFCSVKLSIVDSAGEIIIGNIMYMIPGIGFTNSIRDLFKGDIFAGVHRLVESLLVSFSLAAGYIIAVIITGGTVI